MLYTNINEIVCKYNNLLMNYNKFFFDNIVIYNKNKLLKNIYIKGLKLIENIFNISFLYLDNFGDVFNLCEKSFIYFIEFINQINISNNLENNIELTIKDAIIFCYKKTILNYENTIINEKQSSNNNLYIISKYISILNNLNIIFIMEVYDNFYNDYNNIEKSYNLLLQSTSKKISIYVKKINNNNILDKSINNILYFLQVISEYVLNKDELNYKLFYNIIDKYITKEIYICNDNIYRLSGDILDSYVNNNEININLNNFFNFQE